MSGMPGVHCAHNTWIGRRGDNFVIYSKVEWKMGRFAQSLIIW